MARLVFLVCHLTGTGHLVRTLTLAGTAARRGHDVTVVSGGRPLDHLAREVPLVQLPPVTVRGLEFSVLRKPDGTLVDDAYMAERRAMLEPALTGTDALVTELFPFGRRALADEFLHAIRTARGQRAAILASVRDIPEPKPKRVREVADRLAGLYDAVLAHGDADFLPLSTTWPLPEALDPMIHHTGYIARPIPAAAEPGDEVLISCGGGVLGRQLSAVAYKAAARATRPWRLLIGGADANFVASEMHHNPTSRHLFVEPVRPDFRDLLARAACSVSLCGYNTAVELAGCTTPALLVPSDEAGEQEQTIRARRLATFPGIEILPMADLDADTLVERVERLASGPRRAPIPLGADDGTRAVETIEAVLEARR